MKKLLFFLLTLFVAGNVSAQRMQQSLGRGVVAVQNGSNVTVTWRRLAQEPEDATWNVYTKKKGATTFSLLNSKPLTTTNYKTTTASIPLGSEVAVTMVTKKGGKDIEQEFSTPFLFQAQKQKNVFMEIPFKGGPLNNASYNTKFCWPVDLDGNGEYDYVVNRSCIGGSGNSCIEAYLADGTYLWTVDLGPNELSCSGQDDQICAYDIDCDGYGEVIVQTSDGTRFWNKAAGTWGLYVNGSTTGDTDGDGIIDYNEQSSRNAPRYFTVINGMTGAEKASVEQQYDDAYNRTNKASLMGDEYNKHVGHVGVFYHDGVHPAVVMEWHTRRSSDQGHQYRNSAFAYDFDSNGKATNWHQLFMKNVGGAEFHMIRIFDADGDGKDEMSSGAYCMDHDGSTLYNTGISHGDRHRTSDIDPERPGLETFSIQQNAPDMLGQILFDAGTGEAIKKWYLPAVGDVGRGECMDLDPAHLGWEMFSTMDGYQMYDAKGNKIEGKYGYFPTEGIWWDGQLDRERVDTPDGNGYNAMVVDYTNGRLIEMAKDSGWTIRSASGKRGMFWGDIIGDWREELILDRVENEVNTGIIGFSTDMTTTINNIYCLQEDPHYRGDCTTRGYYQTPEPAFYLGYDMPRPQLPPCMKADEHNQVFDLTLGNASVKPAADMENVYLMPVKEQVLTVVGDVTGNTKLWKSQQGMAVLKSDNLSTESTIISEGTLQVDGKINGTVELRARGTLSGSGIVDSVAVEGALNYEGCRIMPQGTLTISKTLKVNKKTYVEVDIDKGNKVKVNGGLAITASLIFTIVTANNEAGEYRLLEYDGELTGSLSNISVRGMSGLSYNIINKENAICLVINGQRKPTKDVKWTGAANSTWDYQTLNWKVNDEAAMFVAEDCVIFDDEATQKTITIPELMPVGTVEVNGTSNFTFGGNGGISGNGSLVKNGNGTLTLNAVKSDYTGATIINEGKVTVKELSDAGIPSSIGAASADASNFQIGKATLIINNTNTATNRGILLNDTATVQIASGTASFKGMISGDGTLRKTGSGQLNITYAGTNAWAGTILEAGTLAMGAWNTTFGKAQSPIHVTGNTTLTIFDSNSSSTMPNFQNAVTIDTLKTLTFNVGSRCSIRGSLEGSGTIKISFPYVRGDVYTNVSKFTGVYDVMTSNCRFIQAMDFSKATLRLESGAYAAGFKAGNGTEVSYSHKIGHLRGTGTLGTGVWTVYDLGVEDKTLSTTIGTITINGSLSIPKNGTVNVRYYGPTATFKHDTYVNNGATTLNNPHFVMKQLSSVYAIPDDREIQVFAGTGKITLTGTPTFTPARPKKGWVWDTSKLVSEGKLCIKPSPYVLGDANGDKKVTMEDANVVANYVIGRTVPVIDLEASDVDGDGAVTISDAYAITNLYLGK
ncbi:MAG: autotransporter-associated beta strand repeat-containing protein [Prevotella sp.]|nr:autotransporter-associated beta strand repeat-containing protein [Candidatus Prevotella equi]